MFSRTRWSGYPLTIIKDRYGGSYSGGAWTAWPLDPWDIPGAVTDGDTECMTWWSSWPRAHATISIGRGPTPDAALVSLLAAMGKRDG